MIYYFKWWISLLFPVIRFVAKMLGVGILIFILCLYFILLIPFLPFVVKSSNWWGLNTISKTIDKLDPID